MSDIFGERVKGVRITVTRSDGLSTGSWVTGEEGRLEVPPDAWDESFLYCGDFHISLRQVDPGVHFQIPGKSAGVYGELAVLPLDWEDIRVSLKGEKSWKSPATTDVRIGLRFLYLLPGTYELANRQELILGTAEVRAGERTTFTMTRWSGLKVNLSFLEEPATLPVGILVNIRGVSSGASNPQGLGWQLLEIRNGQRSYALYGLVPGAYHVYVDSEGYGFSEHVDLVESKVTPIELRLRKR